MSKFGVIDQLVNATQPNAKFTNITVGEVVDTNDPQQMGRIRAVCPAMGDTKVQPIKHIPWAMYGSPFGGVDDIGSRGRDNTKTDGPVAYGMWCIPKTGAFVLIMCLDGNPNNRVWLGCVPAQFFTHTMPHGRYSVKPDEGNPEGPLTSTENPIEPLHSNLTESYSGNVGVEARQSFEFRTRGSDNQVSYVGPEDIETRVKFSKLADDRNQEITEDDGTVFNSSRGYSRSRLQPDLVFPTTDGINLDSNIYAWVTPGFHSLSMDDTPESCRTRLRTTAGHQVILDDTNERIYISTAQGKTWIEIDEKGIIDIYGEQDISVRSGADINITADQSVRIAGKTGIHLVSEGQIRAHAGEDISVHTDAALRVHSDTALYQTDSTMSMQIGSTLSLGSDNFYISELTGIAFASDFITPTHDLNAQTPSNQPWPPPPPPPPPDAEELPAYFTSRVPQHEPWARVYLDPASADLDSVGGSVLTLFTDIITDPDSVSEYTYTDIDVGRKSAARNKDFTRNDKWHR
jgi:hypothetical protein